MPNCSCFVKDRLSKCRSRKNRNRTVCCNLFRAGGEFPGMKQFFVLLLIAVATRGDGLNQKLVPANTKWLLHLDGEAFRKSRVGEFVINQKLEKFVDQAKKDLNTELDF